MGHPKAFAIYIMTNRERGVLYVGVTSNLRNRVSQHREGYEDARDAIDFEKRLKRWRRDWKIRLIEEQNPEWVDLWPELMGFDVVGPLSHLQGR
jgi:putative endonuclease